MRSQILQACFFLAWMGILAGCAVPPSVVTPAPVLLATPVPLTAEATAASSVIPPSQPLPTPSAQVTPAPASFLTPVASPTVPAPAHPTITETLTAALAYVEAGFLLDMPPAEAFAPTTEAAAPEGMTVETILTAQGWEALIGPAEIDSPGPSRRLIWLRKEGKKKVLSWLGQVDAQGVASSMAFSGLPRPKSKRVKGLTGWVKPLPPGSAYPRYFEDQKGRRYGLATNKPEIQALLEHLTPEDGAIQVWGELRYAVNDYNGRRILVRKYNLLAADPAQILARATPSPSATAPSQSQVPGQTVYYASISQPRSHDVIHTQVVVTGEVGGGYQGPLRVQVEDAQGQVLGQAQVEGMSDAHGLVHFSAEVPFQNPPALSTGRVAVYLPGQGPEGLLGWTEVRFAGDVGDMQVRVLQPQADMGIRGKVLVSGQAAQLPTQTLLVRVEDTAGVVMGKAQASVAQDGTWQTVVKCRRPKTARAGVVAVYVVRADGGLILLAQTPVKLQR